MSIDPENSFTPVREILEKAKIDDDQLKHEIQQLIINDDDDDSEYRFLEIKDEKILSELQSGNDELIIRGDETDTAVLCTKNRTFSLKESETSNSILILNDRFKLARFCRDDGGIDGDGDVGRVIDVPVVGMQNKIIELIEEKRPKMDKLRRMLEENLFSGNRINSDQSNKDKRKYRLQDFLDHVPASERQILDTLSNMRVVEIDGFYRLLDFDYLVRIYTEIGQCIDENGWSWTSVDKNRVIDSLEKEFHELPAVVDTFFRWFAQPKTDEEGGRLWTFDGKGICRLCAEMILKPVNKFNLKDFFDVWPQSVPYGMADHATDKQLAGLAILQTDTRPEYVQYLPADSLPDDIQERLIVLFRAKPKWLLDELKVYMPFNDIPNMGDILMKYCRVSTGLDGRKWYSSKKTVN